MIVGDSKALNSEMINTFINPTPWLKLEKDVHIPTRTHYSRYAVRQQSYKSEDAFLFLVGVDSAARVEIQDLANEVSRARPDALCFLVGTSKNRGAPHGDAELGRIAKFFLDLRIKVLYCDVQHPMSVGQLLAQVGSMLGALIP
ncbi:uncharacterized protein CCOS01_08901 [Colletotrichum costaricense]|uniref:Uncharacterized protein n=2 Tax=Colletotrichum acutatum species complex TaxID=2707335 RepID=A0AAJ0DYJ4_9PEZI|nr:uncharacterized protein CCOS01_08901 [Colletotrichum costaricense]XP_060377428.1 uncharacterized protein CTAM01_11875 [Colletotrichum tamarilloi]KAK1487104.1 hypothetical protein CTAM01_11875 [Colletotrichum tamarilloi]KAK1523814.1 hypothetical protein CCOS01_08901 [Colletotrichum costaricense]